MNTNANLSRLLAPGDVGRIARKLGLAQCTVSQALKRANPGHPAVREAVAIAQASGALATAQNLSTLSAT